MAIPLIAVGLLPVDAAHLREAISALRAIRDGHDHHLSPEQARMLLMMLYRYEEREASGKWSVEIDVVELTGGICR